jgi:hypothetical protein
VRPERHSPPLACPARHPGRSLLPPACPARAPRPCVSAATAYPCARARAHARSARRTEPCPRTRFALANRATLGSAAATAFPSTCSTQATRRAVRRDAAEPLADAAAHAHRPTPPC